MKLLERIESHLRERAALARDGEGELADIELKAATAIVLLEAAYGDGEYRWSEHRVLLKALEQGFALGKLETRALLERAEEIRPPAVTLDDVTQVIASRYDTAQRIEIVRLLWKVIDADRVVEEWEAGFADHVARAVGLDPEQARDARERARS